MNALGALCVFSPFVKSSGESAFAFSAGIMLSASFWSLLLPASQLATSKSNLFFCVIGGVLLGACLIALSDKIISQNQSFFKRSRSKLFWAVTAHNLPEGLAVGFALGSLPIKTALAVSFGIGLQNFPEGLAVALPYKCENGGALSGFARGVVSAVVEPVYALIGLLLCSYLSGLQPFVLSFSAGAMVYVCIRDLIPLGCNKNKGACFFFLGFLIMTALDLMLA